MKKITIVIFLLVCLISSFCSCSKSNEEYLRIHIKANSNSEIDQIVKYEIRDLIVEYLSCKLSDVKSKDEAKEIIIRESEKIESIVKEYLYQRGMNYTCNLQIRREQFPTKSYENVVLEGGEYDAVIINLGEGKGDNWWCVAFPPLCFKAKPNSTIKYKSFFKELFNKLKDKK